MTLLILLPYVLLAMLLGIPAIIIGSVGATCRIVALLLAKGADHLLTQGRHAIAETTPPQQRTDQRPATHPVDTP